MGTTDRGDTFNTIEKDVKSEERTTSSGKAYAIRPKVIRSEKRPRPDRLHDLVTYLLSLGERDFTGYIKVNYSQGSIGRVERFEEILKKK